MRKAQMMAASVAIAPNATRARVPHISRVIVLHEIGAFRRMCPSYLRVVAPLGNHGASAARAHAEADRLAHCRCRHISPDGGRLREAARTRGAHAWRRSCDRDIG